MVVLSLPRQRRGYYLTLDHGLFHIISQSLEIIWIASLTIDITDFFYIWISFQLYMTYQIQIFNCVI